MNSGPLVFVSSAAPGTIPRARSEDTETCNYCSVDVFHLEKCFAHWFLNSCLVAPSSCACSCHNAIICIMFCEERLFLLLLLISMCLNFVHWPSSSSAPFTNLGMSSNCLVYTPQLVPFTFLYDGATDYGS